jgi:hypothetical protein
MSRYLISYQDDVDSALIGVRDVEVVVFMSMEFMREKIWWEFIVGSSVGTCTWVGGSLG